MIRNQLNPEDDPSSRIYCFFLAEASAILDVEGTQLDQLTMINRSLKYLNEFSGKTIDPAIRMGYLKDNYWNSKIINMAKKFKLIE